MPPDTANHSPDAPATTWRVGARARRTASPAADPVVLQTPPLAPIGGGESDLSRGESDLSRGESDLSRIEGFGGATKLPADAPPAPGSADARAIGARAKADIAVALSQVVARAKKALASPTEALDAAGLWAASEVASVFVADPAKADARVIQTQMETALVVAASCYIVYNWYFMQFYHDGILRVQALSISPDALHAFSPMLFLLFKYNVVPLWVLDHFLLRVFPRALSSALSQKAVMVALFALVAGCIRTFGGSIYAALASAVQMQPNSLSGAYMASMLVYAVYSLVTHGADGKPADSAGVAEKFMGMYQNPLMTAVMAVVFILRFLWSSIIVGASALLVALYLLLMSLFAMPIYSREGLRVWETMAHINWYVARPRTADACAPACDGGPFAQAKSAVCTQSARAMAGLYRYAFELALLACLAQGVRAYAASAMNSDLKAGMVGLSAILACMVCGVIGMRAVAERESAAAELAGQKRLFDSARALLGYAADPSGKYLAEDFASYVDSEACSACGPPSKSLFEMATSLFAAPAASMDPAAVAKIRDQAAAAITIAAAGPA